MVYRKRRRLPSDTTSKRSKNTPEEVETKDENAPTSCWSLLLPFLPLAYIMTLTEIPEVSPFVDSFLDAGNTLRIDEKFMETLDTTDRYRCIGPRTQLLVLCGLDEDDAMMVIYFKYFPVLTDLTLENMTINTEHTEFYPENIKSLKIINCSVDRGWLHKVFEMNKRSLRSLHVDRLDLLSQSAKPPKFNDTLPYLRELTLERMDMTPRYMPWNFEPLTSLTLRRTTGKLHFPFGMQNLQHLVIDLDSRGSVFFRSRDAYLIDLKSLTVRSAQQSPDEIWKYPIFCTRFKNLVCHSPPAKLDAIFDWEGLENVQMHCNWYHASQLKKHFASLGTVKNCVITCCAPTPGYNLLDTLNEYCLRKIVSYLGEEDLYKLPLVDPRFVGLQSTFTGIDAQFVKQYPPKKCSAFYDNVAAHTSILRVEGITEAVFYEAIRHFKSLKKLTLFDLKLLKYDRVSVVPLVNDVHIHFSKACGMSGNYWGALLWHLNPRLKRLRLDGHVNKVQHLKELTNIEELYMDAYTLHTALDETYQFFLQNRRLTKLDISIANIIADYRNPYDTLYNCINWLRLNNSIRSLTVRSSSPECFLLQQDILGVIRELDHLEYLRIPKWDWRWVRDEGFMLSNVKTLSIGDMSKEMLPDVLESLPNLKVVRFEKQEDQLGMREWHWEMESELRKCLNSDDRYCKQHMEGSTLVMTIQD